MDLSIFTPTQRRILEYLKDGLSHKVQDVVKMIDSEATTNTIAGQVTGIRKLLRLRGMDIVTENKYKTFYYRWVRMLHPSVE